MAKRAVVTGWGKCVPPVALTNADLERLCETDNDWIVERTGIHSRRISHVEGTDLAELAGRRALASAGLEPEELDLILVATCTPELLCPSVASMIQDRLGAVNAAAFDLNAACSGFVYSTANVTGMIESGFAERVLVIGVEKLHMAMDYRDRSTCILFGDGAGATVYEATDSEVGVLSVDIGADGSKGHTMVVQAMGTRGDPYWGKSPEKTRLYFEGQAVFKIAVQGIAASAARALERAGLTADDVDLVIPHQANARIIDAAARRLDIEPERVFVNIENLGNTAAASIPMAIADAAEAGRLKPGDVVVLTAFGGGITWGSVVMKWGDRVESVGVHEGELPPTDATIWDLLESNLEFYAPLHTDEPPVRRT
ncbi:MAG: beta-ketoacyl-ACP synthase III [Acidimicrobiales bacterium]|nr:beta-ketoacyl-ACP synthase III [Acidimicrobiales bacterium]MDP6697859.1 beta-ketoacyl-ACP synthase III [Acidimicrobiales bacterium]